MMMKATTISFTTAALLSLSGFDTATAAPPAAKTRTPALLVDLTGKGTNPDGMTLKDGDIYLVMNNLAAKKPARIMRITKDDKLEDVIELPVHPETGVVSPLGIGFGADGTAEDRAADFTAVRGTFAGNSFVKKMKAQLQ